MSTYLKYYLALHLYPDLTLREKLKLVQIYQDDISVPFILSQKEFLEQEISGLESFIQTRDTFIKKATQEIKRCHSLGIGIVSLDSPRYPENLKHIPTPPLVLYYQGDNTKNDFNALSIVGSRTCTSQGEHHSYNLSYDLSKIGLSIVSGLALGIDSQAHLGALDAGGRTIAVMGCGVDRLYPMENKDLWRRILDEGGCIYSEMPLGAPPTRQSFPIRNRIIAGLSVGSVFIEGNKKSGALYTCRFTVDYGRELYTYPGVAGDRYYEGNHDLIKQGAKLIEGSQDLLEDLSLVISLNEEISTNKSPEPQEPIVFKTKKPATKPTPPKALAPLSPEEETLINQLKKPKSLDLLVEKTGLATHVLLGKLTYLKIKGHCKEVNGYYQSI